MKPLLFIILLSLSSCRIEYNYFIIPAHEKEKQEVKQSYPVPDRWNYVDVKRLERVSDSIANLINKRYE